MGEEFIKQGYKIEIGRRRTRVVTYENLRIQTTHPIKEQKPKKILPSIPSDYAGFNYYNRIKKRRNTIRELAYNNFEFDKSVLLSLTFDGSAGTDYVILENAHREFKKFIQRINSHYNNFKYLSTFNRQRNGNWHYHVLCNFPASISNTTITDLWGKGYTYITRFNQSTRFDVGVQYLIDNMEESAEDTKGKHGYLSSSNLERNIILTSYKVEHEKEFDEVFARIEESNRSILYSTKNHLGIQGETINEETGEIGTFTIPDRELDPMLEDAGYTSWDSIFTYVSSDARFTEKFSAIEVATPKPKKFKRTNLKKQKREK